MNIIMISCSFSLGFYIIRLTNGCQFVNFQVWKAEADDLNGHDGLTRLVAVKTIKETASQKEKQELLHEIYIMQKIGTHPNVVTLLACCTEQGTIYL